MKIKTRWKILDLYRSCEIVVFPLFFFAWMGSCLYFHASGWWAFVLFFAWLIVVASFWDWLDNKLYYWALNKNE